MFCIFHDWQVVEIKEEFRIEEEVDGENRGYSTRYDNTDRRTTKVCLKCHKVVDGISKYRREYADKKRYLAHRKELAQSIANNTQTNNKKDTVL